VLRNWCCWCCALGAIKRWTLLTRACCCSAPGWKDASGKAPPVECWATQPHLYAVTFKGESALGVYRLGSLHRLSRVHASVVVSNGT
jgi:hypothetical protein